MSESFSESDSDDSSIIKLKDIKFNNSVDDNTEIDMLNRNDDEMVKKLWKGTCTSNMPENFTNVLINFSENKNNYIEEWELINEESKLGIGSFCICSHEIDNNYFYKNKSNNNILRIGSECMLKLCDELGNEKHKKILKAYKRLKKTNVKRFCYICGKNNIMPDKPISDKICNPCIQKGYEYDDIYESDFAKMCMKKCEICRKIDILESPEIQKCRTCYIENTMRKCIKCNELKINKKEPSWKKKCLKCYKLK